MVYVMDELFRALVLVGGGTISVTLVMLGVRMMQIPNYIWEHEQRRLLRQRQTAETVINLFNHK